MRQRFLNQLYCKRYVASGLLLALGLSSLAFNVYNEHGGCDTTAKKNIQLLLDVQRLRALRLANPEILGPTASQSQSETNVTQQLSSRLEPQVVGLAQSTSFNTPPVQHVTQQKGEWWETHLAKLQELSPTNVTTQLFYAFLNVTSDSTCKLSEDGDFGDGMGGPKTPLKEYSCVRGVNPSPTINASNIERKENFVKVNCAAKFEYRRAPGDDWSELSGDTHTLEIENEFLEVKCGYAQEIFMRVEEKEEIKSRFKAGVTKKAKLNIVVVVLDSMSRAGSFHYLPKTRAYIEKLQKCEGHHCAFIFNRAQITGPGTAMNLTPLLCGQKFSGTFQDMVDQDWSYSNYGACKSFIWNILEDFGYVSAYGNIGRSFVGVKNWPKETIDNSHTGHLSPVYASFDEVGQFFACDDCLEGNAPCVGNKFSGAFEFEYLKDFHMNAYKGMPKFSMTHLGDAHSNEAFSQMEDDAILDYIQTLTQQNDTVVHFMSDHGNGNEGWRLPLSVLMVPKPFIEKYPEVAENLHVNQQRLTSWYDMHETYKHIATYPEPWPQGPVENGTESPDSPISLLATRIPKDRTCDQAGVVPQYCACLAYVPWDNDTMQVRVHEVKAIVDHLLAEIRAERERAEQELVNNAVVSSTCMHLEVDEITNAKSALSIINHQGDATGDAGELTEIVEFKYNIKGNANATFKVLIQLHNAPPAQGVSAGAPNMKTANVHVHKMVSTYQHFTSCRDNRVNPHFCVCKDLSATGIPGKFKKD